MAICFLASGHGYSQKYDYNYLDRTSTIGSGTFLMYSDSLHDILINYFDMPGTVSWSPTLSDSEGKFLGYFNSRGVYDSLGRLAINGGSMAVGFFQNYLFQFLPKDEGLGNAGNCAFIPIGDSLYYLIYKSSELWPGAPDYAVQFFEQGIQLNSYSDGLYLTKVRLNSENRLYILPEEKHIVLIDDLFQFGNLMICKHANGDDWWLVIPKALNNMASRMRIYSNGDIELLEEIYFSENYWRVRSTAPFDFSPDGQYAVRLIYRSDTLFESILELLKFNRCDGTLKLLDVDSIEIPDYFTFDADITFSANGKFFYVAQGSNILQFDMEAPHPLQDPDTIAVWDGKRYYGFTPLFDQLWRLPNGRILVAGMDYTPYLHYIDNPDLKGIACNFIQRAIQLPIDPLNEPYGVSLRTLPDFPPFRMPPLESPCNSSTETIEDPDVVKIFPNPTIDIFSITCSSVIHSVEVISLDGIDVLNITLLDIQDHYEFSLVNWPAGVYIVVCRDSENRIIGTKKLVKM